MTILPNVTLSCNEDLSPARTGTPTIMDNLDSNPVLQYTDNPVESCGIVRLWKATDAAGNTAIVSQGIDIVNPLPPVIQDPHEISVPCGSINSITSNPQYANLSVIHPCERPTTANFTTSNQIDRCGFTFNRTWLVQDDCGTGVSFQQTVHILDQQLPEYPADHQVNVDIHEVLRWRQYPGAIHYRVYIWCNSNNRPDQPISEVSVLQYIHQSPFYPGTLYNWQIEYVTGNNTHVQSPLWSFETISYPDLSVTSITLPPMAFSGQTFELSWTVENVGNISTASGSSVWHDAVYIGSSTDFRFSRRVYLVAHRSFVDPQDGYTESGTVTINPSDIGSFFVHVETDVYRQVRCDCILVLYFSLVFPL